MTINAKLLFEPRDLWLGVYWDLTRSTESAHRRLSVYVCVLPMLPIKVVVEWGYK